MSGHLPAPPRSLLLAPSMLAARACTIAHAHAHTRTAPGRLRLTSGVFERQASSVCHVVARVTGHWLTVGKPSAGAASTHTRRAYARHHPLLARHMHLPHAVHATHHHVAIPLVQT